MTTRYGWTYWKQNARDERRARTLALIISWSALAIVWGFILARLYSLACI